MTAIASPDRLASIRQLNDRLRQHHAGGRVMITAGIRALGAAAVAKVFVAVARFDAFEPGNDPYGEHDFGLVSVDGHQVFFKIDPYALDLEGHSPDPADPTVTSRVLTVMLAEEY